ncbi:MAG: hypothetical protein WC071_12360 [Victivallaceae bacterium]
MSIDENISLDKVEAVWNITPAGFITRRFDLDDFCFGMMPDARQITNIN